MKAKNEQNDFNNEHVMVTHLLRKQDSDPRFGHTNLDGKVEDSEGHNGDPIETTNFRWSQIQTDRLPKPNSLIKSVKVKFWN